MVEFRSAYLVSLQTTCCKAAIRYDEECCPGCGQNIALTSFQRWDMATVRLTASDTLVEYVRRCVRV